MILKGKKFIEIYESIIPRANDLLTPYFKSFVDSVAKMPILKTAMITGYAIRLVEEECLKKKIVKLKTLKIDKKVKEILESALTKQQKVTKLVEYFDLHDQIGLGGPVRPYTILPYKETETYFNFLTEDYIDSTYKGEIENKMESQEYYEIIFRNAAVGYYYRTAENLTNRT